MNEVSSNWDVVIIGAGAAGLLAGIRSAELGRRTLLLEKNKRPGLKILMSGGTRCNITHNTNSVGILNRFGVQSRFLKHAIGRFGPEQILALLHAEGLETKVESTGKVFPVTDKAQDVLDALLRRLERSGCALALDEPVNELSAVDAETISVITPRRTIHARKVIVTTGGLSYPGSGTTGDGFGFARNLGHTIVRTVPALTPITTTEAWVKAWQGITLPDIRLRLIDPSITSTKKQLLAETRGSLLFAHFGLSGPVALDLSREVASNPRGNTLLIEVDFLPDTTEAELESQLISLAQTQGNRDLIKLIATHLPNRCLETLFEMARVPIKRRAGELTKVERQQLVQLLKRAKLRVAGVMGFRKAEVTAGGVSLAEVDPKTMQSRKHPALYLAGEVLDIDGPIGGFNFQAAFSTGWIAGSDETKSG